MQTNGQYTYIYKLGSFVCLYPLNFKTAEPIGLNFFVATHVAGHSLTILPEKTFSTDLLENASI